MCEAHRLYGFQTADNQDTLYELIYKNKTKNLLNQGNKYQACAY
jgi:hypothetical protein